MQRRRIKVAKLSEDTIIDFVIHTKKLSPSTESLYLQVIKNLFEYLFSENLAELNISRVRNIIRHRTRRIKLDTSNYYPEEDIIQFIEKMAIISMEHTPNHIEEVAFLRDMRDSALVLTLADTGVRVDEVCKMKIGDIDWSAKRTIIAGRGKKQGSIRFSTRSLNSIRKYLVPIRKMP